MSNSSEKTSADYEEEIGRLRKQVAQLEAKLKDRSSTRIPDFFQRCMSNPKWMTYYTNLTPKTFVEFFETVKPPNEV